MIYLIGGSMRGGKTTLAKKLSDVLNVTYISTDYLRLVVMSYFEGKEREVNFPFEKMFDVSDMNIFQDYPGRELLKADLKESETMWRGIESFIKYILLVNKDYIFEGVHLLPSLVAKYKNDSNFKIILLAKTNQEKILQGLLENRGNGDWIADNIDNDEVLVSVAESLVEYGKYFTRECDEYGLKCINTEDNFSDRIDEALKYLTSG